MCESAQSTTQAETLLYLFKHHSFVGQRDVGEVCRGGMTMRSVMKPPCKIHVLLCKSMRPL